MTVIAYKDGVMAGDSAWSLAGEGTVHDGLIVNSMNKLIRLNSGALYGGAGSSDDRQLVDLLQGVNSADKMPDVRKLRGTLQEGVHALLVLPDGTIWEVETGEDDGGVMLVNRKWHAVGSGRALAMGAMAAGADARQACEIACAYNTYCQKPVTSLTLAP